MFTYGKEKLLFVTFHFVSIVLRGTIHPENEFTIHHCVKMESYVANLYDVKDIQIHFISQSTELKTKISLFDVWGTAKKSLSKMNCITWYVFFQLVLECSRCIIQLHHFNHKLFDFYAHHTHTYEFQKQFNFKLDCTKKKNKLVETMFLTNCAHLFWRQRQ